MKLWKKRWFVLSDLCLFYYRGENTHTNTHTQESRPLCSGYKLGGQDEPVVVLCEAAHLLLLHATPRQRLIPSVRTDQLAAPAIRK